MLNAGFSEFRSQLCVALMRVSRNSAALFRTLSDGEVCLPGKLDDPNIGLRVYSSGSTFSRRHYLYASSWTMIEVFVVFMYRHLALLWLLFYARTATALAIDPHGTIITIINQTQGESTVNLTRSEGLLNETLSPSQNFISYHVPHSPTTLLFHGLGPMIPAAELLQTVGLAITIAFNYISEGQGRKVIANGLFVYEHEFLNHAEVRITVGDFREIGRSMTYYALFDTVRGIGEFMIMPGHNTQELAFEVEVQGIGYVGTGHVDYKQAASPTSSIA